MKLEFKPNYEKGSPYLYPEEYGMERIAEIEWDHESYEFNMTCVLRRKSDGTLWYADDSGCSCPSPFEDDYEWDRLYTTQHFKDRYRESISGDYSRGRTVPEEFEKFIADIERALNDLQAKGGSCGC